MIANELNAEGQPICTLCSLPVLPNGTLPEDSDQRGSGALTAAGDIAIIHKACAKKEGLA